MQINVWIGATVDIRMTAEIGKETNESYRYGRRRAWKRHAARELEEHYAEGKHVCSG
jgi:hypothetical protein